MNSIRNKLERTQALYYFSLFLFLGLSVLLLILQFLGIGETIWKHFYYVYLVLALIYTWYIFTLLFIGELRKKTFPRYNNQKITVVIPCYNEDPMLLTASLESVLKAKGNKEIIIVDDGSTNNISELLAKYEQLSGIQVHCFDRNRGKREALHTAIKHLVKECDYIVTMDSDTIFDENALIQIVEPLGIEKIGAVSGDVRLLNEKENFLTRMIGSYYWVALHIHRKAQSTLGMVSCCSGALAAYKRDVILEVIDEFVEQEFFGERCTYSDDRHLTNLVLRSGKDVVFTSNAIAFTRTPSTYKKFIKQQLRWKRGFLKEATYALTFMWKVKPFLFLEILIWELLLPILSFSMVILIFFNLFTNPVVYLPVIFFSLLTLTIIRHLPALFYAPKKLPGLIYFTFFSHFVMYWVSLYALFTLRAKLWTNR